ncbi:hypothetical protein BCR35DRAFT_36288 [Leucosporidium creatinivorum]|uniref:Uncharacterized protein n=1 Tax=Leucosporidium creatinivorum TaxID=106004 RepID=A0A1Y2CB74_9BASI|nr:hypothetical protein BCR35DRAFT_36288 [Leucosporidium creatinivorum]
MIRKGFEDLAGGSSPGLAWKVVEGLLEGINDNPLIRSSLSSSSSSLLTPTDLATSIRQNTIMTPSGPAVLLPPSSSSSGKPRRASQGVEYSEESDEEDDEKTGKGKEEQARSPIAQMLYTRWVLNLREQREFFSLSPSRLGRALAEPPLLSLGTVGL